MKQSTLELLCCPTCKSTLSLHAEDEQGFISDGDLHCVACERRYPIKGGIVRFIDPQELTGPNRRFERSYNRLAPFYSIFTKLSFLPFGGERKARQEILSRMHGHDGRTLEVSIGNGVNLPYLYAAPHVSEIYGIDISIGQLSQCQKLIHKRDWQAELFLAMAEDLPFKNESFDHILHIGGINFFSDRRRAIEEMIRVARPGSKIVIADESEQLAKKLDRSASPGPEGGDTETPLVTLVPDTMQDIRLEGIWQAHGKAHGYCLEFTKPL